MPIKVACACGAAFAAKDELAGRTVACPKCKQPLTIPRPQAAAAPAAPSAPHANAGLFDDLGLKARESTGPRCPSCAADMAPNAVICVKCGFNTKLGRRMETIKMSGAAGEAAGGGGGHGGGHGAGVTEMLMARAAKNAEDDEVAERSKTSVGAPLWVWLTAMGCVILFGLVMSLIPQHTALFGTAILMLLVAGIAQLYSWVGVMIKAGTKNPLYAVGIFFGDIALAITLFFLAVFINWATESTIGDFIRILTGLVWLTYAYLHSEECGQYIMIYWAAFAMQIVALVMIFIAAIIFVMTKEANVGWHMPAPQEAPIQWSTNAAPLLCTSFGASFTAGS